MGHHASPITKLYHFVDQKMTWTDAQRHCREHFDDLATVDNLEELKQLQESRIGSDYDTGIIWIGLYDDVTRWQWSHGNQIYRVGQHYGNWLVNQPSNGGARQNCVLILSTHLLNDVPCSWEAYAVCFDGGLDFCLLNITDCYCSRFYPAPFSIEPTIKKCLISCKCHQI